MAYSEPLVESSIKILFFSGKPEDYLVWKSKQLAKAGRYGYRDLILGKENIPSDADKDVAKAVAEDKRTDDQKKLIANWALACRGYEDLILSMNTTTTDGMVAWSIVAHAKTKANEYGDAKIAMEKLEAKYAPPTAPSFIALAKVFQNTKLDPPDADPDTFIRTLEDSMERMNAIEIDGKSDKTSVDLILQALANLPSEIYGIEIHQLEHDMNINPKAVTVETMRREIAARYVRNQNERKNNKNGTDERALAVAAQIRRDYTDEELGAYVRDMNFKGKCNHCGVQGHKGSNCPDRKPSANGGGGDNRNGGGNSGSGGGGGGGGDNNGKRAHPTSKCGYCGKPNHRKANCYKRKRELAKCAMDDENVEDGNSYQNESYDELGFVATVLQDYNSSDLSGDEDYVSDYQDELLRYEYTPYPHMTPQEVKQESHCESQEDNIAPSYASHVSQEELPPYEEELPPYKYNEDNSMQTYEPPPKRVRFEPFTDIRLFHNENNNYDDCIGDESTTVSSHNSQMRTNFCNVSSEPTFRYGYSLSTQCKSLPNVKEGKSESSDEVALAGGDLGPQSPGTSCCI